MAQEAMDSPTAPPKKKKKVSLTTTVLSPVSPMEVLCDLPPGRAQWRRARVRTGSPLPARCPHTGFAPRAARLGSERTVTCPKSQSVPWRRDEDRPREEKGVTGSARDPGRDSS